jgi:hypothetical protein
VNFDEHDDDESADLAADGAPPAPPRPKPAHRVDLAAEARTWALTWRERLQHHAGNYRLEPAKTDWCRRCAGTGTIRNEVCPECDAGRVVLAGQGGQRDPARWIKVHDLLPDDPSVRELAAHGVALYFVPKGRNVQSPRTIGTHETPAIVAWKVDEGPCAWNVRTCTNEALHGPPIGSNGFDRRQSRVARQR